MITELAAQARTSVDCARVGSLTTYAHHPSRQHTNSVRVRARADGTVEIPVAMAALAARQLLARPVATLYVAPVGHEPVLLHGAARRLPGFDERGALVFHLEIAGVRVGSPSEPLPTAAYAAADPDPLRHDAPAVLAHLNEGHVEALAACLRAGGHDAAFAHATRLDSAGLTVLAVGSTGVDKVRLRFPAPVATLEDLPVSLGGVLRPQGGCTCSQPVRDRQQGSRQQP